MTRKKSKFSKTADLAMLKIELKPETNPVVSTQERSHRIQQMVAKAILLAYKRGRPCKREEEFNDAA